LEEGDLAGLGDGRGRVAGREVEDGVGEGGDEGDVPVGIVLLAKGGEAALGEIVEGLQTEFGVRGGSSCG
jgi:hypothetical protein